MAIRRDLRERRERRKVAAYLAGIFVGTLAFIAGGYWLSRSLPCNDHVTEYGCGPRHTLEFHEHYAVCRCKPEELQ